jgi:guanylate kinase
MEVDSQPYDRILIVGPGAAGKNYLYEQFPEECRGVKYTMRPMRAGEEHGKGYFFVDEYTFDVMQRKNLFKIVEEFDVGSKTIWKYGITHLEWITKRVFIIPPYTAQRLACKIPTEMERCYVVFLDILKSTRRNRLVRRCGEDSAEQRLDDDFVAFADFFKWNYRVTNARFDREVLADKLLKTLKKLD